MPNSNSPSNSLAATPALDSNQLAALKSEIEEAVAEKYQMVRKGSFWASLIAGVVLVLVAIGVSYSTIKNKATTTATSLATAAATEAATEAAVATAEGNAAREALEFAEGFRDRAMLAADDSEEAAKQVGDLSEQTIAAIGRLQAAVSMLAASLPASLTDESLADRFGPTEGKLPGGTSIGIAAGDIFSVNVDAVATYGGGLAVEITMLSHEKKELAANSFLDPKARISLKAGAKYRVLWSTQASTGQAAAAMPFKFSTAVDIRIWPGR